MEGKLLIAHPLLNDGFFNRSVIYVTSHSDEGAVGFTLNFKTQFLLKDVRASIKNGNYPIYEGGPVARNQLFYLHTLGHDVPGAAEVGHNLFIGGEFEELLQLIEKRKVKSYDVRFFAGYCGWDANQLEGEIKRKHWLIADPPDNGFFINETNDLWGTQLQQIKNSYSIFANFGSDPSMN